MKITRKQLGVCLASIAVILISLAVMLCDFILPLNLWTHPVLTFIFSLSVGFAIIAIILGIINKSTWYFFLSCFCVAFAVIYPFAHYSFWWIGLIIVVVMCLVLGIFGFMIGHKPIALNESPDYKNYIEREQEKEKEVELKKEELPEIKSFK